MAEPTLYGDPPDWLSRSLVRRCDAIGQGLVVKNEDGDIVAANEWACEILSMTWEQMCGVSCLDPRWRAVDSAGSPLSGERHPAMVSLAERRDIHGFLMGVDSGDGILKWLRVDAVYREADGRSYAEAVFVDVTASDVGRQAEGSLQEAFHLVIERSVDVVSRHSPTGEYLYITPSCQRMIGYRPEELVGRGAYDLVHPDDKELIAESHRGQAGNQIQVDQYRLVHKDGHPVLVETVSEAILDDKGNIVEIQAATRDISESAGLRQQIKELEELRGELQRREERLRTLLELLPAALLVIDRHGVVLEANHVADEVLGQESEHRGIGDLLPEPIGEATTRMRVGDRWVDVRTAPVSQSGEILVMLVDVTQPVEFAESMQSLAERDALTGLLSRPATLRALDRLVAEGQQPGVLFVDLDGFKEINDCGGHELGDRVLVEIANRIQGAVRSEDVLGRWGGDEFVVVAPRARPGGLPRIAAAVIDAVSGSVPAESDHADNHTLSASVGIALARPGQSAEEVIVAADRAMYEAKRRGKGCYVVAR